MVHRFKEERKADKNEFTAYIAEVLRDAHYVSLVPPVDVIRTTWRRDAPYSRELRDLIIKKTKIFIVSRSNTHLIFLSDLTKWMAKYLSLWTRHDEKYANAENAQLAARADLEAELFDNFAYIRNLQNKAEQKRNRNNKIDEEWRQRRQAAEQVGEGFVCRVNADGETFVCYTTNKSGTKQVLDNAPEQVERTLADFDSVRAVHKRPRIHRSK